MGTLNIHPKDPHFREMVRELSEAHHPIKRIAALVKLDPRTLQAWIDGDTELKQARELGLAEGQKKLMAACIELAIEGKNAQMLIWLSKQILDMREPDKNINVNDNTEAQARKWLDIQKSARELKEAKAGGVPRKELASALPLVTTPEK